MAGQVGNEDGDVGFQIAPMVDVVFVLMLFFMAMAGSYQSEMELGMNLPGEGMAAPGGAPPAPIIVEITDDGQVIANQRSFDSPRSEELPELRAWLKTVIEAGDGKDPLIIRPTSNARHERIINVLGAAAAAGVKNLTFG